MSGEKEKERKKKIVFASIFRDKKVSIFFFVVANEHFGWPRGREETLAAPRSNCSPSIAGEKRPDDETMERKIRTEAKIGHEKCLDL